MSGTLEKAKLHSVTLAKLFYEQHPQQFRDAMLQDDVDEQAFHLTIAEFDGWLVSVGVMETTADEHASDSIERYGVVNRRNQARLGMSRAAVRAEDHPAYTIGPVGTQGAGVKIRLVDLYTRDEPAEIAKRFRISTRHYQRQVRRILRLAESSSVVSETVRMNVSFYAGFMVPLLEAFARAGENLERDIRKQNSPHKVMIALAAPPRKPRRRKKIKARSVVKQPS
jgi:hypothetical protein